MFCVCQTVFYLCNFNINFIKFLLVYIFKLFLTTRLPGMKVNKLTTYHLKRFLLYYIKYWGVLEIEILITYKVLLKLESLANFIIYIHLCILQDISTSILSWILTLTLQNIQLFSKGQIQSITLYTEVFAFISIHFLRNTIKVVLITFLFQMGKQQQRDKLKLKVHKSILTNGNLSNFILFCFFVFSSTAILVEGNINLYRI